MLNISSPFSAADVSSGLVVSLPYWQQYFIIISGNKGIWYSCSKDTKKQNLFLFLTTHWNKRKKTGRNWTWNKTLYKNVVPIWKATFLTSKEQFVFTCLCSTSKNRSQFKRKKKYIYIYTCITPSERWRDGIIRAKTARLKTLSFFCY